MLSLEFIDKEIEETQRSYESFELDYELFHRESDKRDAEKLIKKLIHLQQIKDIIEAWEVCKSDNSILYVLQTLARGEAIDWHRLPKEKQEILKKALEVKDVK